MLLIPFPTLLANYQQFRNQGCVRNSLNQTCYVEISTAFAAFQFLNQTIYHGNGDFPDIMNDYTCNYAGLNSTYYNTTKAAENKAVLQKGCAVLSKLGCCAGSGIALVQTNQIQLLKGKADIFPPCFLNYMKLSCPPVKLNQFCVPGAIATQTSVQGYITLTKNAQFIQYYPNVYNQKSLLQTQGILTTLLANLGLGKSPYYFNAKYPFQVYIIGYAYYAGTTRLTPTDGTTYWPAGGDYAASTYGNFTYQLVVQNLNSTEAAKLQSVLLSPYWVGALTQAFHSSPTTAAVTSAPIVYQADPTPVNFASQQFVSKYLLLLGLFALVKFRLIFQY